MAPLSEEQKDRWLDLVEKGVDRIEAAHAVGEQASTFQILSLDDPEFKERMVAALRKSWHKRRVEDGREVTMAVRQEFLDLVAEGKTPAEAAHALGGYYWHFARLCNVTRSSYDKEFHLAFMEAMREGQPAFHDRIRMLQITQAENGEYRAVRDMIIQYLPEGEKLASKKIEVRDGDLEALKQAALSIDRSQLTDEELTEYIRLMEKAAGKARPELTAGDA